MEFALGLVAGAFALPWYVLGVLVLVFLIDVGSASKEEFAFATGAIVVGFIVLSGLGWWTEGFNPLSWVYHNPVDFITYFVGYALVGCLWAVAKWWLFLKKVHKRVEADWDGKSPKRRPRESFASNNAGRLTGWIFHWPFSMLGVIIGDFIIKFADTLYKALQGMFERMARARFAGYEE